MSDREIVINGLTLRQKKMLDVMWALDTEDEYLEWYASLTEPMQRQADILMKMIILAELDSIMPKETEFPEAQAVLGKFTLKGHL